LANQQLMPAERIMFQSNLAITLLTRVESAGTTADLAEAVELARRAVAANPDDGPDRATVLSNLGTAVFARFERTGSSDDLDEAIQAWRAATGIAAEPALRAMAGANLAAALCARFERGAG